MRTHLRVAALASVLAGQAAIPQALAEGQAPGLHARDTAEVENQCPDSVSSAIAQGDYRKAYDALLTSLKKQKITPEQPQVLREATLLELIRVTVPEVMTAFAAQSRKHRQFLAQLARDQEWQQLYLSSGLVPFKTPVGLDVLYRIWVKEKGDVKNKKLAVALASVWGGGETAPSPNLQKLDPATHDPVWRYEFFNRQEAAGKLHANYPKLQPWELRFVVAIPA